jgi:hypothetical protein
MRELGRESNISASYTKKVVVKLTTTGCLWNPCITKLDKNVNHGIRLDFTIEEEVFLNWHFGSTVSSAQTQTMLQNWKTTMTAMCHLLISRFGLKRGSNTPGVIKFPTWYQLTRGWCGMPPGWWHSASSWICFQTTLIGILLSIAIVCTHRICQRDSSEWGLSWGSQHFCRCVRKPHKEKSHGVPYHQGKWQRQPICQMGLLAVTLAG